MLHSKLIGQKIADARKKKQLSQAELAQKISISPQAVGKWERGESMPDILTLNKLAELFDRDLNYFSDKELAATENSQDEAHSIKAVRNLKPNVSKKFFEWNWDMSQGNWMDADFSGLKNLRDKFISSNLRNCKFINSDLSSLLLSKNNIENCDFSNSNFRNTKLQSSNISKSQFVETDLTDSHWQKCNIEDCDFNDSDFSGTELIELNFENNKIYQAKWKFSTFKKSNLSELTFSGLLEDCHFEHCSFYRVKFENARIINTFFKYNERFKKVEFINCQIDRISYAFLKNNQANLEGVEILED